MNRLNTESNGGHRIHLDDFRFIESGVKEVLADIVRGLNVGSNEAFRLWGAEVVSNGDNYDISEGSIYTSGEIFHVPAHTLSKLSGAGTYYWSETITNDASGLEVFRDGIQRNTYEIRRLKLQRTSEVLEVGTYIPKDVPTLSNVWTPIDIPTVWTEISKPATGVTGDAYYRKRSGHIEFRGRWISDGSQEGQTFNLPIGFRLAGSRRWYCIHPNDSGDSIPVFGDMSSLYVSYGVQNGQLTIPLDFDLVVAFDEIPPTPLFGS